MTATLLSSITALPSAISVETAFGSDILQMMIHAGPVVKVVLLVLIFLSIISWTIIFIKWRFFRKAKQETAFFLDLFWESTALNQLYGESEELLWSPVSQLFRSGYSELGRSMKGQDSSTSVEWDADIMQPLLDNVERSLRKTTINQNNRFERGLAFLATTGNSAPFIGLFGTVWGIMESFRGIGMKGSASLAVVAPGISEALIATAAGLAAAIPAVVAFNFFNQRAMAFKIEMDNFASDFLSLVERQFVRKRMSSRED